jgi:hypothetical protein
MHFGMVIVGLPYSHAGQMTLEEIVGGAPYEATMIAGTKGERQPSKLELDGGATPRRTHRQDCRQARGVAGRVPPLGSHPTDQSRSSQQRFRTGR